MFSSIKIILVVSIIQIVKCSIDGISYINDRNRIGEEKYKKGEDPCNPLYWYPQMRPSYCDEKPIQEDPRPRLIPLPIPVPAPPPPPLAPPAPPVPIGIPIVPSNPFIPVAGIPIPMPPPIPQQMYMPPPAFPIQPASCFMSQPACSPAISQPAVQMPAMPPPAFAMPAPALPMQYLNPYPQYPMPYPMLIQQQPMIGMVPGINGMVSKDGAINIMPFSDVYADVLEKHRQKVVRKRLENVLDDYDGRREESRRKLTPRRSVAKRHISRPPRNLSE